MNARKIKLALTAGLINKSSKDDALTDIKDLMRGFAEDVGHFVGLRSLSNRAFGSSVQERYALQYENCTLDIDLISYPKVNQQVIQNFKVR